MHKYYLVDAFVGDSALGNPCAIVFMDNLGDDLLLQEIAITLNQPATTFLNDNKDGSYQVRWFAPESEIDLCGHGSVAAVWLINTLRAERNSVTLNYAKGQIWGSMVDDFVMITGDAILSEERSIPHYVQKGFSGQITAYHDNWNKPIVVLEKADDLRSLHCNWPILEAADTFAYVLTALDDSGQYDFLSRVILPHLSKREDQATGSAQLVLAPFWSKQLGQNNLKTFQVSERGGRMDLKMDGYMVEIHAQCRYRGMGELV